MARPGSWGVNRPDHDQSHLDHQQKGNAQPGGKVGRLLILLMLGRPGLGCAACHRAAPTV